MPRELAVRSRGPAGPRREAGGRLFIMSGAAARRARRGAAAALLRRLRGARGDARLAPAPACGVAAERASDAAVQQRAVTPRRFRRGAGPERAGDAAVLRLAPACGVVVGRRPSAASGRQDASDIGALGSFLEI